MRDPLLRGGGTVFGPHKRSYRQHIPVKVKRKAMCSVLSERLREERLCVLNELALPEKKTKPFVAVLERFSPDGKNTLFVMPHVDDNVLASSHNVPRVAVRTAADVNVLDVLRAYRIIVVQEAVGQLEERLT